jgi:tetratricopeptide (TPR) repeat protein
MTSFTRIFKTAVTAFLLALPASAPAQTQDDALDDLFAALREAAPGDAEQIAGKIWKEWSKSGSPAMDLLLERGRMAMEAGETARAIGHLSALIDHAPDFAEAYNARATAYYAAGLYGPALEDVRRTLELNPRHFGAMVGLAILMDETGRDALALRAWREVERLYPQHEGLRTNLDRLERQVEGQRL